MDTDTNDIASGLGNCVTRDGQSPATANIPMGGFKLTNLATGSSSTDSVTWGQVFTSPVFPGTCQIPTLVITTQAQAPSGLAGAPSYSFAGDKTTGVFMDGAGILAFAAGGVEIELMSSTGWSVSIPGASSAQIGLNQNGDFTSTTNINANGGTLVYKVDGTQVVGARHTGYSAMTGTANRVTVYDTSTITLVQLAQRVKALQDDLTTHGLIGT